MKGITEGDFIEEKKRSDFVMQVFWNVHDIIAVSTRLRDALNKRQKQYAVVERIGDVLLDVVPHFAPFVSYGAHQLWGKYEFEKEKNANPVFAAFVEARIEYYLTCRSFTLIVHLAHRTTPRITQTGTQRVSDETDNASGAVSSTS